MKDDLFAHDDMPHEIENLKAKASLNDFVTVKAVIVYNDNGDYLIHGCNSETPREMFKAISSIWHFDPSVERARFVEFQIILPPAK